MPPYASRTSPGSTGQCADERMATLTPKLSDSYVENSEAVAASKTEQPFYETVAVFYFGNRGPRSCQSGPMPWVSTELTGAGVWSCGQKNAE
jgi:hypothetical protein